MNLTKTEALVLQQLVAAAGSKLYGLQMVKASDGQLKLGSVYVLLGRLEDKGFVKSSKEENPQQAIPRRLYQVTGAGRIQYQAWEAAMEAMKPFGLGFVRGIA